MYVTPCLCKVCGLPFLFSSCDFTGEYVGVNISVAVCLSFPQAYASITSIATPTSIPHLNTHVKSVTLPLVLQNLLITRHLASCQQMVSSEEGNVLHMLPTYNPENISSSNTSTLLDTHYTNNPPQPIRLKGLPHHQTAC